MRPGPRFRWSEAEWWAWEDLNQRPHPYQRYQVSTADRCANQHSPRSRRPVMGAGMGGTAGVLLWWLPVDEEMGPRRFHGLRQLGLAPRMVRSPSRTCHSYSRGRVEMVNKA